MSLINTAKGWRALTAAETSDQMTRVIQWEIFTKGRGIDAALRQRFDERYPKA